MKIIFRNVLKKEEYKRKETWVSTCLVWLLATLTLFHANYAVINDFSIYLLCPMNMYSIGFNVCGCPEFLCSNLLGEVVDHENRTLTHGLLPF